MREKSKYVRKSSYFVQVLHSHLEAIYLIPEVLAVAVAQAHALLTSPDGMTVFHSKECRQVAILYVLDLLLRPEALTKRVLDRRRSIQKS